MKPGRQAAQISWALVALLVLATSAVGQSSRRGRADGSDLIERLVFSPRLVMTHQRELGLTERQKDMLVVEMQETQSRLVPLQLEMAGAGSELARLLAQPRVEEAVALETAERIMALETEIKRQHLVLVIRIKNMLTSEQQARLRAIRQRQRSRN